MYFRRGTIAMKTRTSIPNTQYLLGVGSIRWTIPSNARISPIHARNNQVFIGAFLCPYVGWRCSPGWKVFDDACRYRCFLFEDPGTTIIRNPEPVSSEPLDTNLRTAGRLNWGCP